MITRPPQRYRDFTRAGVRGRRAIERTDGDIPAARNRPHVSGRPADRDRASTGSHIGSIHCFANVDAAAGFSVDDATGVVVEDLSGPLVDRDVTPGPYCNASPVIADPRAAFPRHDVSALGAGIDDGTAA